MQSVPSIPITLLTGFLGAGKTTLVNQLLSGGHGRRIAVIVNEFGETGVDAALIVGATGSVIELANGCLCCATRGDLARALHDVLASDREIDSILIETSGLADPMPVIEDLESYRFERETRLDGVVTVLDAENFDRNLEHAEIAYQQIISADLLLINKADLVASDVPARIEAGIRTLNARAGVHACVDGDVPVDLVMGSFDREPDACVVHGHVHDHAHHEHDAHQHNAFESEVFRTTRELHWNRLTEWLESLPENVFRVKGFARFSGTHIAYVVHAVGARHSVEKAPAAVDITGATLVVIGVGLEKDFLQAGFEKCMA